MILDSIQETISSLTPGSVFAYVSLFVGSITGVTIALIQRKRNPSKDIEQRVKELEDQLDEANQRWDSFKAAFTLIYNKYERDFENDKGKMSMLTDLKKLFDL